MDPCRSGPMLGRVVSLIPTFCLKTPLLSRQPVGEIRLEVQDLSGAPVDAAGTLRDSSGAVLRSVQADPHGASIQPNLPYGTYRVRLLQSWLC